MITQAEANLLFDLHSKVGQFKTQRARVACLALLGEKLGPVLQSHEELRSACIQRDQEIDRLRKSQANQAADAAAEVKRG